jgi:ketosteroid isomerase-like protein
MTETKTASDTTTTGIIRKYFAAYENKDRAVAEALVAEDFTLKSPFDNGVNRAEYFEKGFPQSERIKTVNIEKIIENGSDAFVLYELKAIDGGLTFRNTEFITVEAGKIKKVEVFFGNLPKELLKEAGLIP